MLAAWAQRFEMSPWPGGRLIVDDATMAALDPGQVAQMRSAGVMPSRRSEWLHERRDPAAASNNAAGGEHRSPSPEEQLAVVALDGLRFDVARPTESLRRQAAEPIDQTLEFLALGAFLPGLEYEIEESVDGSNDRAPLAPVADGLAGPHAEGWKRAAAMRGAFLPYLAHLRCRELLEGRPATHPAGLSPHDWPSAGLGWAPHTFVGDDLLVAGMRRLGGGDSPFYLPGGEWVDFFEGSRFRDVRKFPEERQPPPPGRVLALLRAGAIVPLFDLAVRAPFATGSPRRPGPPDHLVLKGAPLVERQHSYYDPFAVAGDRWRVPLAEIPRLRVATWRESERVHVVVEGAPRRVTLLLRWHRPGRIAAGRDARSAISLVQVENEQQFLVATDCWLYHAARDEVMIRTRLEPDLPLHVVVSDMG
jgi:hypothetical protein